MMAPLGYISCSGCGRLFKNDGSEDDMYDDHRCDDDLAMYRSRDIGSGVETGEYFTEPLGPPDTWGKRPYRTPDGGLVYLFDDELQDPPRRTELLMTFQRLEPHETNESWRLNN